MSSHTYSINTNGMSVTTGTIAPVTTPQHLIATRAVETKAGWIGQVLVMGEILWESNTFETSQDAQKDADDYVIDKIKEMLK